MRITAFLMNKELLRPTFSKPTWINIFLRKSFSKKFSKHPSGKTKNLSLKQLKLAAIQLQIVKHGEEPQEHHNQQRIITANIFQTLLEKVFPYEKKKIKKFSKPHNKTNNNYYPRKHFPRKQTTNKESSRPTFFKHIQKNYFLKKNYPAP